jgi:hypothetical protein
MSTEMKGIINQREIVGGETPESVDRKRRESTSTVHVIARLDRAIQKLSLK